MKTALLATAVASLFVTACDKVMPPPDAPKNQTSIPLSQQLKEAGEELHKKNYGRTVEITTRIIEANPGNSEARYLQAEAQCLMGEIEHALKSLEGALAAGFTDFNRIMNDDTLSALRQAPEFPPLIQRYQSNSTGARENIRAGNVSINEENGQQVIRAGDVVLRVPKD